MSTADNAIQFRPTGWQGYVHSSDGTLPASGCLLAIHASARLGEIDMTALISGISCAIRLSAADARAVAAELLAAAAAVEAKRGAA
ncbi:hypothetical protein [Pseudorhodoferax sp. Leaf274]|uniref:hypothetical protein n=1 Tax=Pseudorhodoferax sp. Leaf274 TaxID=1736318 RepID=UPI000703487F|nr:hypothetical protein [Pseudorhodoferax sp. Leaf274]KQP43516.1 hypothetical protein ASF44_29760 [Pseudorhodoferax sp. Leaf274]